MQTDTSHNVDYLMQFDTELISRTAHTISIKITKGDEIYHSGK